VSIDHGLTKGDEVWVTLPLSKGVRLAAFLGESVYHPGRVVARVGTSRQIKLYVWREHAHPTEAAAQAHVFHAATAKAARMRVSLERMEALVDEASAWRP
jgi:hypothetical protein